VQALSNSSQSAFPVVARSAGTESFNIGKGAHPTALKVAKEFSLDLSMHIARQVSFSDIEWADQIILMDHENLSRLNELFPELPSRVSTHLLGDCLDSNHIEIPDPYRKGEDEFRSSYELIAKACEKLLRSQDCNAHNQ